MPKDNAALVTPSLAEQFEELRQLKASGAPHGNIVDAVRNLRGQIYSIADAAERGRLFGECNELLKPF